MSSSNWIRFGIALVIGAVLGLVYGWVISPVQYTDVTPGILRADYRADYVLMVAESHQTRQDAEAAARQLAVLGSEAPAQITASALDYAKKNGFTQDEVLVLQGLLTAMQAYQPQPGSAP